MHVSESSGALYRKNPASDRKKAISVNSAFSESVVEDASLAWLEAPGYTVLHGPDIAAGESGAERTDLSYRDILLERRLR